MGDVIRLDDHRESPAGDPAVPAGDLPVGFHFAPASPWTYLAAERVERRFAGLLWIPVVAGGLPEAGDGFGPGGLRATVEARAAELGMPLVWPESGPARTPATARVTTLAAERGCAGEFVLAAGRLAFCGGFDLDAPEVLAEAAAAAGLALDDALAAARDAERDLEPARAALALVERGARELPVLDVDGELFCGERRVAEASAAARGPGRSAGCG